MRIKSSQLATRRVASALCSLICILLYPAPATAQSAPGAIDRDAQRILEQQQQQARERQREFDAGQQVAPNGAAPEATPAPAIIQPGQCAAIHEVRLLGMIRYKAADFAVVLGPVKSDCTTIATIDAALRAITNRYVTDGYITSRAFVGPQDLKSGTLTITVFEGQVSAVKGVGDKPYGKGELGAAFAGVSGQLNLRALEQGVDQLARMGKAEATIDIAPGEVPGTSNVLVRRKAADVWLRPILSLNNYGSASTGRWQASLGLDADSLLGLADVWSLYYQRNASNDALRGNSAVGGFMSLPHGWWTLSLSAGASRYRSVLEGNGLSFVARGTSWNGSAMLDRMVMRSAATKLSLVADLTVQDSKNYIQGIQLQTGSYRIASAGFGVNWQHKTKRSLYSGRVKFEQGLGLFGAHTVDTGPGGARGKFSLISADFSANSQWKLGRSELSNLVVLRGQLGLTNLFPAQRFSLGGPGTVRGFNDDGISGRSGMMAREQLGLGLGELFKGKPARTRIGLFAGVDMGAIAANSYDLYERGFLASASGGLRLQGRYLQAELTVAAPLSAPSWVRHKASEISATMRIAL